ncbi:MAG: 3-isopropylmalate dehydratase small subunit [Actinomycetota bacterium]|nr:3-isopropylmalate dehydratase small subunit [Actinomycetota bacterium]
MDPVKRVSGKALPLGYSDVDTDQIVPSDALKRIERTGFGQFLFSGWREDPDFVMNKAEHEGAVILLAGENFGSGSSREHAPWALQDYGFGAIIAPSFADIFKNNCAKIGLLAVELPKETVQKLLDAVQEDPQTIITVELTERIVSGPNIYETFEMDDFTRQRLMEGLDDISLTLTHEEDLEAFEKSRPSYLPKVLYSGLR